MSVFAEHADWYEQQRRVEEANARTKKMHEAARQRRIAAEKKKNGK